MDAHTFSATLTWNERYQFDVAFDGQAADWHVDEAPPLGAGDGPNPARLLAAAVGQCLASSLLFCLAKARIEPQGLTVRVDGSYVRSAEGRLRIGALAVTLEPGLPAEAVARAERCLGLFEDYCVVTQSVRAGVDVSVHVAPVSAPAAA